MAGQARLLSQNPERYVQFLIRNILFAFLAYCAIDSTIIRGVDDRLIRWDVKPSALLPSSMNSNFSYQAYYTLSL